jgi:tetratricopeptide (TPR) repeat protein
MAKYFFFFILSVLALPAFAETDYFGLFYTQMDIRDETGMESTLKNWAADLPNDAEMLSAYGEYYDFRSLKGKAAQSWITAIRQDPARLDFYWRLARLYQDMGNFEAQYSILAEGLQYADRHPSKMRWKSGKNLPLPREEFTPYLLQGFMTHYFKQHKPESDEKVLRLARLTVTFFPNHPYAYNCMAAYFYGKQDWPRALKSLLLANVKAPRDSLVVRNIGNTLSTMGKFREAKIFYRRVVNLNNDKKNVAAAKTRLEELAGLKKFANPSELSPASIILHKVGG